VARLERQPGQKENRWAQLLGGELPGAEAPSLAAVAAAVTASGDGTTGAVAAPASSVAVPTSQRLAALEGAVEALRDDMARLRADHDDLLRQLQ
jgi:hypothetical protein